MTGRTVRNFSVMVWLASLVGASLACANPRRATQEQPALPPPLVATATVPAATVVALATATEPPTGLPPTASAAPTEIAAPSATPAPQPTAAPAVTATAVPDPQGDLVEQMLDQFDQANSADEAALNDLPANP